MSEINSSKSAHKYRYYVHGKTSEEYHFYRRARGHSVSKPRLRVTKPKTRKTPSFRTTQETMIRNFFRNNEGKLVIWQFPNLPLLAALLFGLLARIVQGALYTGFKSVSMAFFFTWAYLEIRSGESMFRRTLGAFVMASIIASYFMKAGW